MISDNDPRRLLEELVHRRDHIEALFTPRMVRAVAHTLETEFLKIVQASTPPAGSHSPTPLTQVTSSWRLIHILTLPYYFNREVDPSTDIGLGWLEIRCRQDVILSNSLLLYRFAEDVKRAIYDDFQAIGGKRDLCVQHTDGKFTISMT